MKQFDYDTYLSPFTWRYATPSMRHIWSEVHKRFLWRQIWVALAKSQKKYGLINAGELRDLEKHSNDIDIEKANEIEKELHHDLMSEIKVFAAQAKIGGGKLHLGATSMDIEDNADAIRLQESLKLVEEQLKNLLSSFAKKVDVYKDTVCMGYTHLQPAEPTTLGYRFAFYAQDLMLDLDFLQFVKTLPFGKGMKGAVGTSASYTQLVGKKAAREMNKEVMKTLGVDTVTVANQTAPRKLEFFVASALSGIAQSLYKFAFDVRLMQAPGIGEWSEPFGKKQVGSSAMPFKRNPIKSEQICSLARLINNLANISKENAQQMLLERTLDDSANRRVYVPELFLATDSILSTAQKIIEGLVINESQMQRNLEKYGPFAAIETVLMETAKNGADRQLMHETLRELSLKAWEKVKLDKPNPLTEMLRHDKKVMRFLKNKNLEKLFAAETHIGLAVEYCKDFLKKLHETN